jgi:hypothetical protein
MEDFNEEIQTEPELSHSDKIIGLFTEPSKTFAKISLFPPKIIDWLLPIVFLFLIIILGEFVKMKNPDLAYQLKQKQIENIEKTLTPYVEKGQMTAEQKEQRVNESIERMDKPFFMILGYVGIIIIGFIAFFIITGIYFLLSRFVLKGEGTYASALVANGMTSYIGVVQIILATILSYALGRIIGDLSLASFLNSDKTTVLGFVLSKLDIISIWSFTILSIAYSKMFKSESSQKYFTMVFGIWIFWCVFSFWLSKAVPWLNFTR